MSKYIKSQEGFPSTVSIFNAPITQTAIQDAKIMDIYPQTSIENSDTISFIIPALPKSMLEKVEIVTELRVVTADGENLPVNTNVSTVPHLAAALWRNVTVSIGSQQLLQSFDNSYTMFKFFDTLLHMSRGSATVLAKREGMVLDTATTKPDTENLVFYPDAGAALVNKGGKQRAERIKESRKVCLVSDFNISILKHGQLLPPNLEIKINLTKNDTDFILLAAADNTNKIVLDKVMLTCRYQTPRDMIINLNEERLAKENSIYRADKNVLSFRPITAGVREMSFDNVFNGVLPYFFIIGVQSRPALGRNKTKNPFSLHKIQRVQLYIDGQQHFPNDVERTTHDDTFMFSSFLSETGMINGGDTMSTINYDAYPVVAFDLTPDKSQNQHGLSLQKTGSARLTLGFEEDTPVDNVLMIMAYYDQVVEISKAREVTIV